MNTDILNKLHDRTAAPERHFAFPHEVIDDPSFSTEDKRAILCEWASDACAVPSFPTLRLLPGTTFPVTFSAVMDALAQLDRQFFVQADPTAHHQHPTIVPIARAQRDMQPSFARSETGQHLQV